MPTWAVIPAKDPALAKSRLAPDLSVPEREAFSTQTLRHVIRAVISTPGVARCIVVSGAAVPLAIAAELGAIALVEEVEETGEPPSGWCDERDLLETSAIPDRRDRRLNMAVLQGARAAATAGASALLVTAADLPLVDAASLASLIASLGEHEGLALASDRHGRGTNALFVRPALSLPFAFGTDSLALHLRLAARRGLPAQVCQLPNLALDIDTVEDVRALLERMPSNAGPHGGRARGSIDLSETPGSGLVAAMLAHHAQPCECSSR